MARKKSKNEFKNLITSKLNFTNDEDSSKEKKISNEDENVLVGNIFKPVTKAFPPSIVEHSIYSNIPSDKRVDKFTDIGTRIIVAMYPAFYKLYFMKYIEAGIPCFPRGGIKVYNCTYDQVQYFYYESVAVHPTKKDKYRTLTVE